ncbi:hypothetical protein B484DRAFT_443130 [Ochromonadaceae sp. CCMP2298]|nr:hypothetical protein B484DRAFT_443130 [Ochromonadaceae sp. CCMP2298]
MVVVLVSLLVSLLVSMSVSLSVSVSLVLVSLASPTPASMSMSLIGTTSVTSLLDCNSARVVMARESVPRFEATPMH